MAIRPVARQEIQKKLPNSTTRQDVLWAQNLLKEIRQQGAGDDFQKQFLGYSLLALSYQIGRRNNIDLSILLAKLEAKELPFRKKFTEPQLVAIKYVIAEMVNSSGSLEGLRSEFETLGRRRIRIRRKR